MTARLRLSRLRPLSSNIEAPERAVRADSFRCALTLMFKRLLKPRDLLAGKCGQTMVNGASRARRIPHNDGCVPGEEGVSDG